MNCIIVCNGFGITKKVIDEFAGESFIICADGGANHLMQLGIVPDILIGDFDSISSDALDFYKSKHTEILNFPPEKDYTDSELAIETAISKGFKDIVILGGIGSRMDHTMANVFLLKKLFEEGCRGILADENNIIQLVTSEITIKKYDGYKLTLLPLTQVVEGITTKGLYYPLENFTLVQGSTRGVSNEFLDEEAHVSIKSGMILLIISKD